jgi:uncharacterized alkaline shock family protein YloU
MKEENSTEESAGTVISGLSEEENAPLGIIKIENSVIGNIVRLETLSVSGVYSIGGSFEGIAEMFSRKEERGVKVHQNENQSYSIDIHVVMEFGVNLADTAQRIQRFVHDRVMDMTGFPVAEVNVFVDGVKPVEEEAEGKSRTTSTGNWSGGNAQESPRYD